MEKMTEEEMEKKRNLWIIPTDKPSRLIFDKEENRLLPLQEEDFWMQHQDLMENQQIYITSDEEIKEGQNYIGDGFSGKNKFKWHKGQVELYPNIKQDIIILTTDKDLIKDGVQAIDDEFLEWFVKNPSCEEVEVFHQDVYSMGKWDRRYKIIIPKEEETKCYCGHTTTCDCGPEEPKQDKIMERFIANAKQETLEEVAEKIKFELGVIAMDYQNRVQTSMKVFYKVLEKLLLEVEKKQQERMYSEEEVLSFLNDMNSWPTTFNDSEDIREWFEQFKKK